MDAQFHSWWCECQLGLRSGSILLLEYSNRLEIHWNFGNGSHHWNSNIFSGWAWKIASAPRIIYKIDDEPMQFVAVYVMGKLNLLITYLLTVCTLRMSSVASVFLYNEPSRGRNPLSNKIWLFGLGKKQFWSISPYLWLGIFGLSVTELFLIISGHLRCRPFKLLWSS